MRCRCYMYVQMTILTCRQSLQQVLQLDVPVHTLHSRTRLSYAAIASADYHLHQTTTHAHTMHAGFESNGSACKAAGQ